MDTQAAKQQAVQRCTGTREASSLDELMRYEEAVIKGLVVTVVQRPSHESLTS